MLESHIGVLSLLRVDWIEAAEVLKKLRHSSAQVDDDQSADEGNV